MAVCVCVWVSVCARAGLSVCCLLFSFIGIIIRNLALHEPTSAGSFIGRSLPAEASVPRSAQHQAALITFSRLVGWLCPVVSRKINVPCRCESSGEGGGGLTLASLTAPSQLEGACEEEPN